LNVLWNGLGNKTNDLKTDATKGLLETTLSAVSRKVSTVTYSEARIQKALVVDFVGYFLV
jgi:hypothetical protein